MTSPAVQRAAGVHAGGPSRPRRVARQLGKVVVVALLLSYGLLSVFPFFSMLGGALKTNQQVIENPLPFTSVPTLRTLTETFAVLDVPLLLGNSVVLAVGSCLLILVVFPIAGYAFAVLQFPFKRVLFGLFVAAMFVPGVTVLLPIVILDQSLGLIGNPLAVILPQVNGAGPLAIILLRAYYATIPHELHESAVLDGCREFWIFARVYFPLSRSALITVTVINFVGSWNEYVLPRVTNDDPQAYPLPVGLQSLLAENVVQWNQVMAASVVIVIPIIVLFVVLQRFFVSGLQGSVKA